MEYIETGTFNLDISKLSILTVMQRALYNKVFNIDVFINKDKLTIVSKDLSGNTIYILKEQDINEDNLRRKETASTAVFDTDIGSEGFQIDESDLELFGDSLSDEDLDLVILDSPEKEEEKTEVTLGNTDLLWNVDEIDKDSGQNIDFGIDILEESIKSLNEEAKLIDNGGIMPEKSYKEPYNERDFDAEPVRLNEKITINVGNRVCRFGTTISMLKSLAMFKNVTLEVGEDKVKLISKDDLTAITFPKIKSYVNIEEYNDVIKDIEWERFPSSTVKSVIPLIDKIEPDRLKQKLIIKEGQVYVYSDTVAVSANIRKMFDNYILNSDMLRLMKYATSKWSNVYVGFKNRSLAFNIDGLIVIYPYTDPNIPRNLVELLNEDKLICETEIDRQFGRSLDIVNSLGDEKTVTISVGKIGEQSKNFGKIETNKLSSIIPLVAKKPFKFNISLEKLLLAIKISGTRNPNVGFYLLKGNKIILVVRNKDLKVVIEGNNYME